MHPVPPSFEQSYDSYYQVNMEHEHPFGSPVIENPTPFRREAVVRHQVVYNSFHNGYIQHAQHAQHTLPQQSFTMGTNHLLATDVGSTIHSHTFMNDAPNLAYSHATNHIQDSAFTSFDQNVFPTGMPISYQDLTSNTVFEHQPHPYSSLSPEISPEPSHNYFANGFPISTTENHSQSPTGNLSFAGDYRSLSTENNHQGPIANNATNLSIVLEDPRNPCHYEKTVRSKKDPRELKENNRLLRELGGACIWCYRRKKACGLGTPCQSCQNLGRECIRAYTQLSLAGDTNGTTRYGNQGKATDQLSEQFKLGFSRLKDRAFRGPSQRIVVIFRAETVEVWDADAAKLDLAHVNTSDAMNQQLDLKCRKYVRCDGLVELQDLFPGHLLMQAALNVYRLFSAIMCLSKGQVYVQPADVDQARVAAAYLLAVQFQKFYELTDVLCSAMFTMVRRKESRDRHTDMEKGRSEPESLNPVWVAAGLYHRVLQGLESFEPDPFLADLFMDAKARLDVVRPNVLCILKTIPYTSRLVMSNKIKDLVERYIPAVHSHHFDVAILVQSGVHTELSTAMPGAAGAFAGSSYNIWSLSSESFDHSPCMQDSQAEIQTESPLPEAELDMDNLEAELAEIEPFDESLWELEFAEFPLSEQEGQGNLITV